MRTTPELDAVYAIRLENAKRELENRRFGAEVFPTADAARSWLLEALDPAEEIGYGGSRTLAETGILDSLRGGAWKLLDRDRPGIPAEERASLQARAMGAGAFLASANAIVEDGRILNVDCYANRLAAIAYGPKRVFLVAGRNKLARTPEEALARLREASVANATRLKRATPCVKLGRCADCRSEERICAVTAIHEWCPVPRRITVLLVNEDLGF